MATDNVTTQSATLATIPASTPLAARAVTYSGDSAQLVAPVGLVAFAGSDDAKVVFDLGAGSSNHLVSAGSTNATSVKGSAGLLCRVQVFNNAAYPVYVKFHNTSGAPTPGSGVVYTVGVQAGVCRDALLPMGGRYFATGIGMSIVKGIADADSTAVLASDCVVDVDYV